MMKAHTGHAGSSGIQNHSQGSLYPFSVAGRGKDWGVYHLQKGEWLGASYADAQAAVIAARYWKVVDILWNDLLNNGGFTAVVSAMGKRYAGEELREGDIYRPYTGYAVAINEWSPPFPLSEMSDSYIQNTVKPFLYTEVSENTFFQSVEDAESRPDSTLATGGWHDKETDRIYIETSRIYIVEAQARAAAVNGKQIAYYDLGKKAEVRIK